MRAPRDSPCFRGRGRGCTELTRDVAGGDVVVVVVDGVEIFAEGGMILALVAVVVVVVVVVVDGGVNGLLNNSCLRL